MISLEYLFEYFELESFVCNIIFKSFLSLPKSIEKLHHQYFKLLLFGEESQELSQIMDTSYSISQICHLRSKNCTSSKPINHSFFQIAASSIEVLLVSPNNPIYKHFPENKSLSFFQGLYEYSSKVL